MDTLLLVLRVVLSLGAVVLLLWLVARRLAKSGGGLPGRGRTADPLRVVARRGVGQKASVVVLETGGQRFLLGVTEHGINVLHTAEAEAEPDFALSMAAARAGVEPLLDGPTTADVTELPLRSRRRTAGPGPVGPAGLRESGSPLEGSILSPATWKQAAGTIRKGLLG
ncbi:MAG: FliO/MopB family protein [Actinomycetales bacterium]